MSSFDETRECLYIEEYALKCNGLYIKDIKPERIGAKKAYPTWNSLTKSLLTKIILINASKSIM